MHILVVGAAGFIGKAVVDRLATGAIGPISSLTLLDLHCPPRAEADRIIEGSYADAAVRAAAFAQPVDLVFHLASLAGGAAEADFARGRATNLDGTLALLDAAAAAPASVRLVYTSSIAALDMSQPLVTAGDALRPTGSYGTHKAMVELYIADLTRRGAIDGRCVRPSGVVARPTSAYAGFATWWMSDLFRAAFEGRPLDIPATARSAIWLQSIARTADNIVHAARLPAAGLPAHRVWTLPTTVVTVGEIAAALEAHLGRSPRFTLGEHDLNLPAIDASEALAAGFWTDGDAAALVTRVVQQLEEEVA